MKILFVLFCSFSLPLFCQSYMEQISFLAGTWKVENKEHYEVWKLTDSKILEGYAYTLIDGSKSVTETLTISEDMESIVYKATVLNQNDSDTISFVLNKSIVDAWSFENETHDFPKKIIYKKLNESILEVSVLGDNIKEFSLRMIKQ